MFMVCVSNLAVSRTVINFPLSRVIQFKISFVPFADPHTLTVCYNEVKSTVPQVTPIYTHDWSVKWFLVLERMDS